MIDLGAWASDQYTVAGKPLEGDDFQALLGDAGPRDSPRDPSSH